MQTTQQSIVRTLSASIWAGTIPLSFEAVKSFFLIAEETRRKYPIVLCALLQAARNRESLTTHDDVVPQNHIWMTSLYEEAIALLLGPIFYQMKIGAGASLSIAVPREDALESFRYDLETHREMLKLLLQGIH